MADDSYSSLMIGTMGTDGCAGTAALLGVRLVRPVADPGQEQGETLLGDPRHVADRPQQAAQRYRRLRHAPPPDLRPLHHAQGDRPGVQRGRRRLRHGRRRGRKSRPEPRTPRIRHLRHHQSRIRLQDPLCASEQGLRQTGRSGRAPGSSSPKRDARAA